MGAYTTEKGGINISYKDPLIFVQGPPPVYMKRVVVEEESTSVFVPNEESVQETLKIASLSQVEQSKVVDPIILGKILYLSGPFQRAAYKPLQFLVEGKSVKGTIQRVEDDLLWIDADDEVTKLEIGKIDDVLWRGQSFETE